MQQLKEDITAKIRNKFPVDNTFTLASALDLRFKGFPNVSKTEEDLLSSIITFVKDIHDKDFERKYLNRLPQSNRDVLQFSANSKFQKRYGDVMADIQQAEEDGVDVPPLSKEITEYLNMPKISDSKIDTFNLLHWWRDREKMFPILSVIAKKVLCIVATSAESERCFKRAGDVVTRRRSNTLPSNVNILSFINRNASRDKENPIDDDDVPENDYL